MTVVDILSARRGGDLRGYNVDLESSMSRTAASLRRSYGLTHRAARERAAFLHALRDLREDRARTPGSESVQQSLAARLDAIVRHAPKLGKAIRAAANASGTPYPILIVPGGKPPRVEGESYHHRWGGRWKTAPGSYVPSTQRVEVGVGWILRHAPKGSYREALVNLAANATNADAEVPLGEVLGHLRILVQAGANRRALRQYLKDYFRVQKP